MVNTTPVTIDEDKLLNTQEAAELLGFSRYFIKDHTSRKEPRIPFVRVGARCVRFRRSDLRAWVAALAAKKQSR
jgi:excisionase family DNA binding protein